MNLYELDEAINSCIRLDDDRMVDTSTGEVLDLEAFGKLVMARNAKIENLALYIKNEDSRAKAIKAEIDSLAVRMKAHANEVNRCKEYLGEYLNGEKFESAKVKIGWRKSEAVNILDMDLIPKDYLKFKDPEVDKMAVKKAIKAGKGVAGAELVTKNNLNIK